jgi:phosphoribosylglycinamide formyltransferase-1
VNDQANAMGRRWRVVALLSGAGRTLQNLIEVIGRGELDVEIVGVIASRGDVYGINVARDAGLPCRIILPRNFETRDAYSDAVYDAIARWNPDLVLMCGFLRQLNMPEAWAGRVLNIHPSLLPETRPYAGGKGMYGIRVHTAVLANGDMVSGATVHLVDAAYDNGPPLMRAEVPVLPNDTPDDLAARVFEQERVLFPAAISAYMAANPHLKRPT